MFDPADLQSSLIRPESRAMKNTDDLLFVGNINWRLRTLQKIDVSCVCVHRLKEE